MDHCSLQIFAVIVVIVGVSTFFSSFPTIFGRLTTSIEYDLANIALISLISAEPSCVAITIEQKQQ